MAATNTSDAIRNRGNKEYAKAFGKPPANIFAEIRIRHAESAKLLYLEASKVASGSGEQIAWLSAKKNLGLACMRLAEYDGYQKRKPRDLVLYQFKESLIHLSEALYHSQEISHTFSWTDGVASIIKECCDLALKYVIEYGEGTSAKENYGLRCSTLNGLITQPAKQTLALAIVRYMMADEIIKASIVADEEKLWSKSFSLAVEAERPIKECEAAVAKLPVQYGIFPMLSEELRDLQHSRLTYLVRSESANLREIAKSMQEDMLFEHENLDMDLFWVCADHYRSSMITAAHAMEGCTCHENEAIAASNLGKLFDKVLKMHSSARVLYMHAIHLADVITHQCGATFFKYDWYQDAKHGIEEDNTRNDAYDTAKVAEQREPILLKLKPELDEIEKAIKSSEGRDYSAHALLLHLHAKHPPKGGCKSKFDAETLDKNVSEDVQEAVVKAVRYYHPDRKFNKSAGIEWQILCTEIIKYLNNAYARYKA